MADQSYKDASSFDQLAAALLPRGFGSGGGGGGSSGKERAGQNAPIQAQLDKARRDDLPLLKRPIDREQVQLPVTHSVALRQHKKAVSALEVDRSGARLATGSHDMTVALWDFAGMDTTLAPFRYFSPAAGYPVRFLRFSNSGDSLLGGAGGALRLFDRNGKVLSECAKGDPYLRDMRRTTGHVGAVHAADWHPLERRRFATSGQDGTLRFWTVEEGERRTTSRCEAVLVVKSKTATGTKTADVTQVKYTSDGASVICAVSDGSIRMYDTKGPWLEPTLSLVDAHENGSDITCLAIDAAGQRIASRGSDDTLKLWDIRCTRRPVGLVAGLPNVHAETSCVFSPDQRMVATGCSVKKGSGLKGTVSIFDAVSLTPILDPIPVTESSVVALAWATPLNQIICGNADGSVTLFFDPTVSQKGALLPLAKAPASRTKEAVIDFAASVGTIQTPNALPLFRDDEDAIDPKRLRMRARKDPLLSHRPEQPVEGPGKGGRIGSSVTQSIMKHVLKDTQRDEDPREALLKYAEIAEREPLYVTPAYQQTQPKPIFDEEALRKETEDKAKKEQEEQTAALLTRKIQDKKRYH